MGIGDNDGGSGGSEGGDDVYNGSMELVLVLLSNLYYKDDEISVSNSRYSSCPAYTNTDYLALLTTALRKL